MRKHIFTSLVTSQVKKVGLVTLVLLLVIACNGSSPNHLRQSSTSQQPVETTLLGNIMPQIKSKLEEKSTISGTSIRTAHDHEGSPIALGQASMNLQEHEVDSGVDSGIVQTNITKDASSSQATLDLQSPASYVKRSSRGVPPDSLRTSRFASFRRVRNGALDGRVNRDEKGTKNVTNDINIPTSGKKRTTEADNVSSKEDASARGKVELHFPLFRNRQHSGVSDDRNDKENPLRKELRLLGIGNASDAWNQKEKGHRVIIISTPRKARELVASYKNKVHDPTERSKRKDCKHLRSSRHAKHGLLNSGSQNKMDRILNTYKEESRTGDNAAKNHGTEGFDPITTKRTEQNTILQQAKPDKHSNYLHTILQQSSQLLLKSTGFSKNDSRASVDGIAGEPSKIFKRRIKRRSKVHPSTHNSRLLERSTSLKKMVSRIKRRYKSDPTSRDLVESLRELKNVLDEIAKREDESTRIYRRELLHRKIIKRAHKNTSWLIRPKRSDNVLRKRRCTDVGKENGNCQAILELIKKMYPQIFTSYRIYTDVPKMGTSYINSVPDDVLLNDLRRKWILWEKLQMQGGTDLDKEKRFKLMKEILRSQGQDGNFNAGYPYGTMQRIKDTMDQIKRLEDRLVILTAKEKGNDNRNSRSERALLESAGEVTFTPMPGHLQEQITPIEHKYKQVIKLYDAIKAVKEAKKRVDDVFSGALGNVRDRGPDGIEVGGGKQNGGSSRGSDGFLSGDNSGAVVFHEEPKLSRPSRSAWRILEAVKEKRQAPYEEDGVISGYSIWSQWSACSVTCGQGRRHRTRYCQDQDFCKSGNFEEGACSPNPCSLHWPH